MLKIRYFNNSDFEQCKLFALLNGLNDAVSALILLYLMVKINISVFSPTRLAFGVLTVQKRDRLGLIGEPVPPESVQGSPAM